jgi:inosose dehydratase
LLFSRRQFVAAAGASVAAAMLPASAAGAAIRFGYAAITWGGRDREAIADVAALGFRGIQLRASALRDFGANPGALRELLAQHHLTMVALSSGNLNIEAPEADELARHTAHARFVKDVGGLYLQVTDARPPRPLVREDYRKLGRLMTELGQRTADLGIPLGYHNHMNAMGEKPEEVDWILQATDNRYARLELDIAHYLQGGGDPAKAIQRYGKRLLFLHLKDVEAVTPAAPGERNYRFVELGRGRVDLPAVFAALRRVHFRGWAIVELDAVPDPARTPKECGAISKRYLEEKLGFTV